MSPSRTNVLAATLVMLCISGCSKNETAKPPAPTFTVDGTLAPTVAPLPGPGNTTRPVAAVADSNGVLANFVEQELLLVTDDASLLNAFVARWNGAVLATVDPNAEVDGHAPVILAAVPKIHLVRIDASLADASRIGNDLQRIDPKCRGTHRVSSAVGLGTLAAAAREGSQGLSIGLNFVMTGATYADRMLADAPTGDGSYTPNAFDWQQFRQGGPLDIGVAEAWRALDQAGKLVPGSIGMAIIDGGFRAAHSDYPAGVRIVSAIPFLPDDVAPDLPNTMKCGGIDCPWHGTAVAMAAFGLPDNGIAAAGTAGPVARPSMVTALGDMFTGVQAVIRAAATGASIINMSFGVPIPGVLGFSNGPFEATTAALHAAGVLMFAAAGNDAADVDAQDCFLVCWESVAVSPCENTGVHCVGGTELNVTSRDSSSAYGRDTETDNTVDIGAPFQVYGVRAFVDPNNPSTTDPTNPSPTRAFLIPGTSVSSPFVAGVAALIWAANPGLSAGQVENILFSTARPLPGTGLKRLVNAHAAVTQALAGAITPDGGVSDGGMSDGGASDGGTCDIAATWSGSVPSGPFAGQTNAFTLASGGTYSSVMGTATLTGTWMFAGTTLTVTDTTSNPAYIACPAGQAGTYQVAFGASCNSMTLMAISEPCAGRQAALDGFAPTRQ